MLSHPFWVCQQAQGFKIIWREFAEGAEHPLYGHERAYRVTMCVLTADCCGVTLVWKYGYFI